MKKRYIATHMRTSRNWREWCCLCVSMALCYVIFTHVYSLSYSLALVWHFFAPSMRWRAPTECVFEIRFAYSMEYIHTRALTQLNAFYGGAFQCISCFLFSLNHVRLLYDALVFVEQLTKRTLRIIRKSIIHSTLRTRFQINFLLSLYLCVSIYWCVCVCVALVQTFTNGASNLRPDILW